MKKILPSFALVGVKLGTPSANLAIASPRRPHRRGRNPMATSSILAFWAVALLLIVTPGADWAFTLSAGLRGRSVIPAVGGLVLGYAMVTVIIAAGVGALVAGTPAILTGLTIVGGIYLIWHGATTFAKPSTPSTVSDPPAGTDWNTLVKGIGVSGLNPKGLLIFVALVPQFTNP